MNYKITIIFIFTIFLTYGNISYAKSYGSRICHENALYDCYKVKKHDTWTKLFPDEQDRELVKRINRMNISLHSGMIIAVPKNIENANLLAFSPFETQIDPPGRKTIIVNFSKHAFAAYDANGNLKHWGPISGGKGYCPDLRRKCNSPRGTFYIYSKQGSGCASTKFPIGRGGAPMPYCMFFHEGFALHGSHEVPGYHASHGCVRMFTSDAKWLNQEFTDGEKVAVILQ